MRGMSSIDRRRGGKRRAGHANGWTWRLARARRTIRPGGLPPGRGRGFLLALVPVWLVALQSDTHVLQLSDAVGQSSRYRLTFDIRMRAEYTGSEEPDERARELLSLLASGMSLRTALEYEQRLGAVAEDGTREYEVRWHDYEYAGEIGGQRVAPPDGHARATQELLQQRARFRTTPQGRTLEVRFARPGMEGLAKRLGTLENAMPTYLPDGPVAVGDRWTSTARFPVGLQGDGGGDMVLELEHTLLEVRPGADGPVAVIGLSGSYSRLQALEGTGLGVPLHVEASLTGTTMFDVRRGRFTGGRYEVDMFALHAESGVELRMTGHANGSLELLRER